MPSKILTFKEFGSQISLPDMLPKLNTFDISLVIMFSTIFNCRTKDSTSTKSRINSDTKEQLVGLQLAIISSLTLTFDTRPCIWSCSLFLVFCGCARVSMPSSTLRRTKRENASIHLLRFSSELLTPSILSEGFSSSLSSSAKRQSGQRLLDFTSKSHAKLQNWGKIR